MTSPCRKCASPDCRGCNIYTLITALGNGLFDEWMDDNKCVHVPELNHPHLDTDILEEAGFEL